MIFRILSIEAITGLRYKGSKEKFGQNIWVPFTSRLEKDDILHFWVCCSFTEQFEENYDQTLIVVKRPLRAALSSNTAQCNTVHSITAQYITIGFVLLGKFSYFALITLYLLGIAFVGKMQIFRCFKCFKCCSECNCISELSLPQ